MCGHGNVCCGFERAALCSRRGLVSRPFPTDWLERALREDGLNVDQLFTLAFRDNAFDLVQSTVCTRCAMFDYVAANFTRAAALASFGGSSLDTLGRSHAIWFEAGIGGSAFGSGRVNMDGVCGGRRRRIGEVVVHWVHCV
jgi:hypothetical protein